MPVRLLGSYAKRHVRQYTSCATKSTASLAPLVSRLQLLRVERLAAASGRDAGGGAGRDI